jgi:hypothetical protein
MPARYFSVEEANTLLVEIEPLMAELLARRARVVRLHQQVTPLQDDLHTDFGGPLATELALDFNRIEQLLSRIQSYGCVVKDMNVGLLDFLSERDGREVYLCWRYGEPRIEYYHELHTGFGGRQHV